MRYAGLDDFLDLDGELFPLGDGFWVRFEVALASRCPQRPHGIKYSLTLHDGTMKTNVLKVGIMSLDDYRRRTIAIAAGKSRRPKDDPKVWFESIKSMAQVHSSENQALLKMILDHKPTSLTELGRLSKRNKANLSRTLKKLEQCGIVDLTRENGRLVPKVKATEFRVEFGLNYSHPAPQEN